MRSWRKKRYVRARETPEFGAYGYDVRCDEGMAGDLDMTVWYELELAGGDGCTQRKTHW